MNFPVGTVLFKGDVPFDLFSTAQKLFDKKFNGYLILTVKGHFIEEGVLFFREGEINGAIVECLSISSIIKGNDALEYFFNQTKGNGYYQCVELTRSQIDLITAFDEKLLAPTKIVLKDLPKIIPNTFLPKFERTSEKKSALDAYGLGELK
ncbi:MAG: hypothetical protein WCW44_01200 [archaeon]